MYKTGNIVKLKSGGPSMTVDKVNNNKVSCVWFKNEHLKVAIFRKNSLVLADEEVTEDVKLKKTPLSLKTSLEKPLKDKPVKADKAETQKQQKQQKNTAPKKNEDEPILIGKKDI